MNGYSFGGALKVGLGLGLALALALGLGLGLGLGLANPNPNSELAQGLVLRPRVGRPTVGARLPIEQCHAQPRRACGQRLARPAGGLPLH